MTLEKTTLTRHGLFFILLISSLIIFYLPLSELLVASFDNNTYSHIIFIPFVSLYFIYSDRKTIFTDINYSFSGCIFIIIGFILFLVGIKLKGILNQNDCFSLTTLGAITFWIGGFILIYGLRAFINASFPLFFLIFMVPVPTMILDKIILILQIASTEVSYIYFKWTGVPIYRDGFIFELPGISIEVAKQCGGIRSSLVLFILSILSCHIFLKKWWQKIILILSVLPITIIKNGLRIVTLSLLAVYVDESILDSAAHKRGGYLFFLLALAEMALVLWVLKKMNRSKA